MSDELDVLKSVVQRLEEKGMRYMITGSMAMNFYAVPRMTRDIDIVVELDRKKVDLLYEAFKNDFYVDRDTITKAVQCDGMFNIIHNEKLIKIDFIIRKESEYRVQEINRRRKTTVGEASLYIVSPEDLIISKLFRAKDSHSEFQLSDVQNILEDVGEIDQDYLEKWIDRLGLKELYKEVK